MQFFRTSVNLFVLFALPLLFLGVITRVKSFWAGRQGASILQPFYDVIKLMQKGEVISTTTTEIFRIAPTITFASVILAGCLAPLAGGESLLSFEANMIVFAYILATGKFFAILGAMDTGSSFEGMGASREASFSVLVEPAFFMLLGSLCLYSGVTSFRDVLSLSLHLDEIHFLITILSAIILFIMLLAEGCRVPVDDPNTHLELTMIHEVMILDNSGPDLGFLLYASAMKMTIIGAIIANLLLSPELPFALSLVGFLVIQGVLAVGIGTIESLMARVRMTHVPQFLLFMTSTAFILLAVIIINLPGK